MGDVIVTLNGLNLASTEGGVKAWVKLFVAFGHISRNVLVRRAVAMSPQESSSDRIFDAAARLHFNRGDRIEVEWTISDNANELEGGEDAVKAKESNVEDWNDNNGNDITIWWAATLSDKTTKLHTLTDEERSRGTHYDSPYKSSSAKVPIYQLKYDPLEGKDHNT